MAPHVAAMSPQPQQRDDPVASPKRRAKPPPSPIVVPFGARARDGSEEGSSGVPRPPATAPLMVGPARMPPTPTAAASRLRRRTKSLPSDAATIALLAKPASATALSSAAGLHTTATVRKSAPSRPVPVDRALFRRFDDVSGALARLRRVEQMDAFSSSTDNPEMAVVRDAVQRLQRSSSRYRASQLELLEEIEKQQETQRAPLRRYLPPFFVRSDSRKVDELKHALCEQVTESVAVESELERLERRSDVLADNWRRRASGSASYAIDRISPSSRADSCTSSQNGDYFGDYEDEDAEDDEDEPVSLRISRLEREKEALLTAIVRMLRLPEVEQLQSHIAMYASEAQACTSILAQIDRCVALYRQGLQLLRMALATIVSSQYTGSAKEFANGPYSLTVEAGQLMLQATHVVQPEAQRRYCEHAKRILDLRLPKFPSAVGEFARRARTNFDPRNALALEASRRLPASENALVHTHKVAIEQLEALEAWKRAVARDQQLARSAQQQLEDRLQQRLAVLARSVSV